MAVRNLQGITNRGNALREEEMVKKNLHDTRVYNALDTIKLQHSNIVDAVDTLEALYHNGMHAEASKFSPISSGCIYLSSHDGKKILGLYKYHDTKNSRSYKTTYIYYYIEDNRFEVSYNSSHGCSGCNPETETERVDADYMELIELMASKVGAWCQSIFDFAENL